MFCFGTVSIFSWLLFYFCCRLSSFDFSWMTSHPCISVNEAQQSRSEEVELLTQHPLQGDTKVNSLF